MEKNKKLLEDFTKYCEKHPEQRFWQALCNWSGQQSILASNSNDNTHTEVLVDTFYWENKTK